MKKISIVLLILLFSTFAVFAVTETTNEATFNIKAYKIGNSGTKYLTLSVFDALTGNLDTITSDDLIDLTNYTDKILNPIKDDSSYSLVPYDEHVAFSLRVSGNAAGNLSVSVTITPFQKKNASDQVESNIEAYYEMRDITCVFTTNYKSTTDTNGKIELTKGTTSGTATSSSDATMGFSMNINGGNATNGLENWRAQASIGVSIKNSSYESASNGSHYATVTIGVVTES